MQSVLSLIPIIISSLALTLSVLNFITTRRNQRDQNRRWDDLNNAHAELGAVHTTIFRTLKVSEEELADIIVGNVPAIYSSNVSDGKNTEFHQLSLIIAVDALTGENIQHFNPRFTAKPEDVLPSLEKVKRTLNDSILAQQFEFQFKVDNLGKTPAKKVHYSVDIWLPGKGWQFAVGSKNPVSIAGGKFSAFKMLYRVPISIPVPEKVYCKVFLNYHDRYDVLVEKTCYVTWDSIGNNFWLSDNESEEISQNA